MSEEVAALDAAGTDVPEQGTSVSETGTTKRQYRPKLCKKPGCKASFVPTAMAQRYCELHRVPKSGTPEHAAYKHEVWTAATNEKETLTDKALKQLLESRGFSGQIVQTLMRFGASTAELLKLTANEHFWTHGPTMMLKQAKPDIDPAGYADGELLDHKTLFALYEYCAKGRKIIGQEVSYEEWLALRFKAKTDLWFLCVEVCGKGLVEKTHREMIDLFVKKNPTLLKPGFNQDDLNECFRKQDVVHERMLLFPRSFYKSTVSILDIVQWLLCFPDCRCLVVTATLPLAEAFVGELNKYFILRQHNPTNLALLFPEYTVTETKATEFYCPMATLGLKEPQVWASAEGAENTGFHCTHLIFDDFVSAINSNTPELRDKLYQRFNLILELADRPFAFIQIFGTRYSGDKISPDLYGRLLDQNEKGDEQFLKYLIKGAWEVRPHAFHKRLQELTEDDVDLLFPVTPNGEEGKGSFRQLRKKLLADERTFRQQQLNEGLPDEDDLIRCTFPEEQLRQAVKLPNHFTDGQRIMRVMSVDAAMSTDSRADYSCIVVSDHLRVAKFDTITRERKEKNVFFITHVKLERLRTSELGALIAQTMIEHMPDRVVIERANDWQALNQAIFSAGMMRGYALPSIFWKQTKGVRGRSASEIAVRAKTMEPLLSEGRLFFSAGISILDQCFAQLIRFDGIKKSGSSPNSKDDFVAALSLLTTTYQIREQGDPDEKSPEQQEMEQKLEAERLLRKQHDMYFGVREPFQSRYQQMVEQEQPAEQSGLHSFLDKWLPKRAA